MTSEDRWEQRTDSRGPIVPIEKFPRRVWSYKLTHAQVCKHRQTGSSHCSSFVYTLTFSQHLSYVLYTFGKRGPFSNWGPYCSFCYKSPVWMPKQTHTHTHTHTHTVHMALVGYFIVFSFVTKPGQTLEFLLWGTIVPLNFLAGYHCSIVASTPQPMAYASTMFVLHTLCGQFFYSCTVKKNTFFKPLPFAQKILFWSGCWLGLSLELSIPFCDRLKLRFPNLWKPCVDVCKST